MLDELCEAQRQLLSERTDKEHIEAERDSLRAENKRLRAITERMLPRADALWLLYETWQAKWWEAPMERVLGEFFHEIGRLQSIADDARAALESEAADV